MSFRLGRIVGIPISVDLSWFVIFALIVYTLAMFYFPQMAPGLSVPMRWLGGVIAALLLFGSVLLHELMHSIIAIRNGIRIGGINLFIFGGVSRMQSEPQTPEIEFKMAIAGPLTSLMLAAIFYGLLKLGGVAFFGRLGVVIVGYLALINVVLGVFNLIPGFPLDGGRVFRAILWGALNDLDRATRIASYVGQGFAYLFIVGGFWSMLFGAFLSGLWLVFIGWFLNNAAQQSYQQVQLRRALSGVDVHRVMSTDFPHLDPNLTLDEFVHDYLLKYGHSAYPVTDGDQFLGVVTINEAREVPRERWHDTRLRDVVKHLDGERVIKCTDDAFDALMHMAENHAGRMLVMCDGKLEGVVTQENVINLVRTKMQLGM